jgi:hypothetical protein
LAIGGSILGSGFVSIGELDYFLLDRGNDENPQHYGTYNSFLKKHKLKFNWLH